MAASGKRLRVETQAPADPHHSRSRHDASAAELAAEVIGRSTDPLVQVTVALLKEREVDLSFLLQDRKFRRLGGGKALVVELLRFLMIKASVREYVHGTHTSPSAIVDEAWHILLLYTQEYDKLCKCLTGDAGFFHHDPRTADSATADARYARTLRLYERLFGVPAPGRFWTAVDENGEEGEEEGEDEDEEEVEEDDDDDEVVGQRPLTGQATGASNQGGRGAVPPAAMSVIVKDLTGRQTRIALPGAHVTVLDLKEIVQEMLGIPPDQQRIIFGGQQWADDDTLADCNIIDGSVIHLVLKLRGC